MFRVVFCCTLVAAIAVGVQSASAGESRYVVTSGGEVRFHSEATMESFDGWTEKVEGWFELDVEALPDSLPFHIEVDMSSLDTGIGLRNQHMRENHLETDKFPKAVFRGGRASEWSAAALDPGAEVTMDLTGEFELHGVTHPMLIEVRLTRPTSDPDMISVSAEFDVKLEDFGISRPKFLFLKLAESQRVTVSLQTTPED